MNSQAVVLERSLIATEGGHVKKFKEAIDEFVDDKEFKEKFNKESIKGVDYCLQKLNQLDAIDRKFEKKDFLP